MDDEATLQLLAGHFFAVLQSYPVTTIAWISVVLVILWHFWVHLRGHENENWPP